MKHFQWKHLRAIFLLTALPVDTLGNGTVMVFVLF